MVIKFCEVTLALKYRRHNRDGSVSGGPMYYIEKGFAKRRYHALGKTLSYIFALALANWLGSMIGYDKVKQAIEQIISK